ncbi:MAG: GNAT family N-acetyltransferase [Steroidobacteraceae bacterium]
MQGLNIDYLCRYPQFIPALANFSYQEWLPVYRQHGKDYQAALHSYAQRINTDSLPLALVVTLNGELLGSGSLKLHDIESRRDLGPWLGGMYVVEQWRGRGIGTLLLEHLLSEAARLKLESLYLWTASAQGWYARHGWHQYEQLDYCGYQGVLMHRTIY